MAGRVGTPFLRRGNRQRGVPPYRGFSDTAGPGWVWRVCGWVREARECGAPMGRPAPGPVLSCFGLLFLFFLPVFCVTACRGESLMQEASGLLAPSLRVSLPLLIGRVRRAAPQRPGGLWLSHAWGASTTTPRAKPRPAPNPASNHQGDNHTGCRNSPPVGGWSENVEGEGVPVTPRNGRRGPAGGAVRGHAALAPPSFVLWYD